jgi:hypothetical protein
LLILNSCKKEETAVSPPIPGNEVLTTVKLRFENATNANDTLWAVWKDLSDGANPPDTSKAIINLKKSTSYKASVYFSDETKTPASDITATIKARANYHSYWFFKTGAIADNLSIAATDFDTNSPPLPVGLENNFVTSATTGTGRLEGVLRHQPNSKNGTYTPGSTDSDVFFTLNIIP